MASKKKAAKDVTPAAPEVSPAAPPKPSAKKPAASAKLPAAKSPAPKSPPAKAPAAKGAPAAKPLAPKSAVAKGGSAPTKAVPAKPAAASVAKPDSKHPPAKTPAAKAPPKGAPKSPSRLPPPKAPTRARAGGGGGGLDDVDEPDDDDLEEEDEEEEASAAALPPTEDEDEAPVAVAEPEVAPAPRPAKRLTPRPVPPMPPRKPGVVTVALSPDADDAFMLYALAHGKIETEGRAYEFVRGDIATLNDESKKGTYDVTAFSFGAWPQVVERYLALPCGASFGDGVGPVVVSKTPVRPSEVDGMLVGVPGLTTTAALVLRLWLAPARLKLVSVPFQEVVGAVKTGKVRAGVLIHEAQLTYRLDGLAKVMDLGRWWTDKTEGLPLPLGGTAIRRDIPTEERTKIALDLKRSIAYAMGHREEALEHAAKFSKGLPRHLLDRYVTMYVNELTLDIGERGRQAVHTLFDYAVRLGTMKERVDLELA
jgi:1,4-dihydroxy-6-naphthoate synthase